MVSPVSFAVLFVAFLLEALSLLAMGRLLRNAHRRDRRWRAIVEEQRATIARWETEDLKRQIREAVDA